MPPNLRLAAVDTVAEKSETERAPAPKNFRFMDLAPELRNRIYMYASQAALEIPVRVVTPPPRIATRPRPKQQEQTDNDSQQTGNETSSATTRRDGSYPLAMLFTCRQIYCEASQIYYGNMSVDFRDCHLPAGRYLMIAFGQTFKNKLQFVRHIEVDCLVALPFLFAAKTNKDLIKVCFSSWRRQSPAPEFAIQQLSVRLFATRALFYNLESIRIHPTRLPDPESGLFNDSDYICWLIIGNLASGRRRPALDRLFPRLGDIKASNKFGSERYGKRETGQWELYYSHEEIPIEMNGPKLVSSISGFYDPATKLTIATTLGCRGS